MIRQRWKGRKKQKHVLMLNRRILLLLAVSGFLIVFGTARLIISSSQRKHSEKTDEELRSLYYQTAAFPTLTPAVTHSPVPESTERLSETPSAAPASGISAGAVQPTHIPQLKSVVYPGNPSRTVSERFVNLRKQSRDIIGWLTIGSMVDEAVVQRDNEFYMDHNAKGQPDVSGAIFLDSFVSLDTRPYALILYGHNMRTGDRFGSLRNYDSVSFYRNYPFIDFSTLYEEGSYVIFSVGTVSTEENDPHYLDFFSLLSRHRDERQQAIDTLLEVSLFTSAVDVRLEDQILLLVTCENREEDRRIVAARRIRDGEKRQDLKALAESGEDRVPVR